MRYIPKALFNRQPLSIHYSADLIAKASVTPNDNGCQIYLMNKLSQLGFDCQQFSINGVSNTIASIGKGPRTIAFAGHTDVVTPGNEALWQTPPFKPTIINDELIGRGAADMKTGIAAMLAAIETHIADGKAINQRFMWLITSDEEGEAEFGSKWIANYLQEQGIDLDMCIVGEPSSVYTTGDAIKVGRRGSLTCYVDVKGKQGHVAYPDYALNAIHKTQALLTALLSIKWDQGSRDFPGTSLQVTHINSGTFTDNLVPSECKLCFNIRYSAKWTQKSLIAHLKRVIQAVDQQFELTWDRPCEPYLTQNIEHSQLIKAAEQAIVKEIGKFPVLSTSGGTSDGRFFCTETTEVVELGVPNTTIHQVNERVACEDIARLERIYTDMLTDLLS
ncbi:succinyl-diaminopimelate desuccinylase [Thalassotalea ganghwensis]